MSGRRRVAACVVISALVWLALASAAFADGVWTEGTASSPFSLVDPGGLSVVTGGGGDPALTLPYEASTAFEGAASALELRSIRMCKDGSYLVACGKHNYVARISPTGVVKTYGDWKQDSRFDVDIPGLVCPFDATELGDGGMLIVDRVSNGEGRVIRLDKFNQEVWRFGFGSSAGLGARIVWDPFMAEVLPDGHMLITDSKGQRVIEIDDAGALVWSYGTYQVPGSGPELLDLPHSAERLANGDTLICDSNNQRVIEVSRGGQIVWSYGTTGVKLADGGLLSSPNSARRMPSGTTLISDTDDARAIEVDRSGTIVREYGGPGVSMAAGALSDPRAAIRLVDGSTLIADNGHNRLERYGYEINRQRTATSGAIDPAIGTIKWFTKISVTASVPLGAQLAVDYSVDGTNWVAVPTSGVLSPAAQGSAIRYRVGLTTNDANVAPTLNDVSIAWQSTAPAIGSGNTKPKPKSKPKPKPKAKAKAQSTTPAQQDSSGQSSSTLSQSSGSGDALSGGNTGPSPSTLAQPGAGAPVANGTSSGNGVESGVGAASTTMSGWVMSEVKDDAGGTAGSVGAGGFGLASTLGKSKVPGVGVLLAAYTIGLAWSPVSKLVIRAIAVAMAH